jgi:hypothetical protein
MGETWAPDHGAMDCPNAPEWKALFASAQSG